MDFIYENDDETFDIWTKEIGIPADRIVRLGKEDNFWGNRLRTMRSLFRNLFRPRGRIRLR